MKGSFLKYYRIIHPMTPISGVDLHYLTKELQILIAGRVDKLYQLKKKEFLFNFHKTGVGKLSLHILLPGTIHLTKKKYAAPEQPMGYCTYLRKRLNNSRLEEVSQVGTQRILKIVFKTKEESFIMYIELFSKGNIILCNPENSILQPLERQTWKDREIKAKIPYKCPEGIDLKELDEKKVLEMLKTTGKDTLGTFIAIDLSIGGKYSEEICSLGKFDKKIDPKVFCKETKNVKKLTTVVKKLLAENKSISEIVDNEVVVVVEKKPKKDKVDRIIESQTEHIKKLEKDIKEYNKIGELIYSNYQVLEKVLSDITEARKTMSLEDIKKKVKNKKLKDFDLKEKTVMIELN